MNPATESNSELSVTGWGLTKAPLGASVRKDEVEDDLSDIIVINDAFIAQLLSTSFGSCSLHTHFGDWCVKLAVNHCEDSPISFQLVVSQDYGKLCLCPFSPSFKFFFFSADPDEILA